jgi:hypothetical protein
MSLWLTGSWQQITFGAAQVSMGVHATIVHSFITLHTQMPLFISYSYSLVKSWAAPFNLHSFNPSQLGLALHGELTKIWSLPMSRLSHGHLQFSSPSTLLYEVLSYSQTRIDMMNTMLSGILMVTCSLEWLGRMVVKSKSLWYYSITPGPGQSPSSRYVLLYLVGFMWSIFRS